MPEHASRVQALVCALMFVAHNLFNPKVPHGGVLQLWKLYYSLPTSLCAAPGSILLEVAGRSACGVLKLSLHGLKRASIWRLGRRVVLGFTLPGNRLWHWC